MKPIYIVGAGPGDPELLTIKAQRLLAAADLVVWAGSLINPAVLQMVNPSALSYDSSELTLEQIIIRLEDGYHKGQTVVRLHTGDPSIYGAIHEQIRLLGERGIPWEIVPGVSSFLAAAATLGIEYTIPEITQTLILTRAEGRTPVPEQESLAVLAKHQSSICIFLSMQQFEKVVRDLQSVLPSATKIAVVEKVTWPAERIITGTLMDISAKVKIAGIERTALIIVGKCLEQTSNRSKLYDPDFSHGYRKDKTNGS
jgi:precorrin-4/cobalt-precorrin-4 C11-methyltransferase